MALLYIISLIAIVIQILGLTIAVGKSSALSTLENKFHINLISSIKRTDFYHFTGFPDPFSSRWPLLRSRIGGRVHSNCEKGDHNPRAVRDNRIFPLYVRR